MIKKLKYIVVLVAIALVFFVKNKIDARNKTQQNALDSIDDGISKPKLKK